MPAMQIYANSRVRACAALLILPCLVPVLARGQTDPPAWNPEKAAVTLPYSELKLLWEAANRLKKEAKEIPPPVDAVVRSLVADLIVSEESVRLVAQFEVQSLADGWHAIPLLGGSAPLIKIQPAEAEVVWRENRYALLRQGPGSQSLTLEFAAPRQPGAREKLIDLAPQNATVQVLNVSGIPQDRSLEVNGKPVLSRSGSATLPLTQIGPMVVLSLSSIPATTKAAAPSTWNLSTQAVVRYQDGALHQVMRLFAQDQTGAGQHLRLQLPDHARNVQIQSEGLTSQRSVRSPEGALSYDLTWEEAGTLDRKIELRFETPVSPLASEWTLCVPQTLEKGGARDALYAVVLSPGLEIVGDGITPGSASKRISEWYQEQMGNADFVSLQIREDTQVRPRWLPLRSTAQATITEAHFETQLEKSGRTLNRATYAIEHEGALTWPLKLPPGCEVLRCTVNGLAVAPVARDETSIEFGLTPDGKSKSQVEISYTQSGPPLEPIEGSTTLTLLQTSLFIRQLDWKLEIPAVFAINAVDGNVEVSGSASGADSNSVLLTKSLCQGEAPSVEVFYHRPTATK